MNSLSKQLEGLPPKGNREVSEVSPELELSLWSMYVDKLSAAVCEEFERRGIDTILLKGPAIATWLYDDAGTRPYGDADVMVSPRDWARSQQALLELGFDRELAPLEHPRMESLASESWLRGSDNIDLHCTLWGLDAPPETVWATLAELTEPLSVQGRSLRTLRPEARTLLLATHAAKHGDGQPFSDLERAVQTLPLGLWRQSAALAMRLYATRAFVAGLQLVPAGRELVMALGLPDVGMPEASLRAWRVPMALGFEYLSRTPGATSKLGVVRRELFPTPAFLRWWTPMAARGSVGLGLAYVWRLVWVTRHAFPAWRAWRRARRELDQIVPLHAADAVGTRSSGGQSNGQRAVQLVRSRRMELRESVKRRAPQRVRVWRHRRHQQRVVRQHGLSAAAELYMAEHGQAVTAGPFVGMRLPLEATRWEQCAVIPLLAGSYEREIHPFLDTPGNVFVDVGCAEGCYLVGMALRGCEAIGFEIDPVRRRRARALAKLNGVEVDVRGPFRPDGINFDGALVLCDIEGAEAELIPAHAAHLTHARIVIEFHHESHRAVIPALEPTHDVRLVRFQGRQGLENEHRDPDHVWGIFEPRSAAATVSRISSTLVEIDGQSKRQARR